MQGGRHVDAGRVVVGAVETDVFRGGVGADALKERREAHAAPLADRAPALDTDVARDLRGLRQRVELGQRPGLLVADHAGELELVALAVDLRDLVFGIERVEREGFGDCALRVFRGELHLAEYQPLSAVVPARHARQHPLHALVVGQVAARKHRERAERQALPEEQAPLDRANELRRLRRATRLHVASFHEALLARPVIMVGKVRGTSITMTMWTSTINTISAMAQKCTMRAPSYPPMSPAISWNCTGFQIARPE